MADDRRVSKTLSFWLRHKPGEAGLELDSGGWTAVGPVLDALSKTGLSNSLEELERVVRESDKQRFELSADGALIRARQGHSVAVDLDWPSAEPPEFLFHGTVERFLPEILAGGLRPMKRHHVHLSPDVATARAVGARCGRCRHPPGFGRRDGQAGVQLFPDRQRRLAHRPRRSALSRTNGLGGNAGHARGIGASLALPAPGGG